jgi:CheY-like chemotaxis protein
MIDVLVADKCTIRAHLIGEALNRDRSLRVVGATAGSREFLELAARHTPNVAVLSAMMDEDPNLGMATGAEGLCVVGEFVGQELQGDVATELEVFRFVDHTHTATADLAEDAVVGNRLTDGLGERVHRRECYGGAWRRVNKRKRPRLIESWDAR